MKKVNLIIIIILLISGINYSLQAQDNKVEVKKVEFMCQGSKIVGNLYTAKKYKDKKNMRAIIVVGPATGIKEQVSGTYAEKLAEIGYITLAFDHRGYGESGGTSRTMEDMFIKSEDIRTAISFVRSLKQVDETKVGAIGICAGAGYLIETAIGENRLAAIATISGTLSYQGVIAASGGEALLVKSCDARQKYDETGEVTYIPIIAKPTDASNVFANEAYEYYVGNQDKYPTWKNQVALSSFSSFAALDIKEVVSSLKKPVLYIAGSKAMTAPLSQVAYDNTPDSKIKELYWVEGATHISLYHNEEQINEVSGKINEFFKKRLKSKSKNFQKNLVANMVGFTYETNQKAPKVEDADYKEINDGKVVIQKVVFKSHGTKIVANLFIPANYKEGSKLPGIVVVGPATGVKEQVAGEYAYRLADKGFITLAFDHRTYGESEGLPRCCEGIIIKSEDIKSAISFMCSQEQVDKNNVGAIGICAGGGFLVQTAPGEKRIKALATISGTLSSKKVIEEMPGGDLIISMSNDAKQKYDNKNEATYMRLFAKERPKLKKKEPKLSKFQQEAFDYYVGNADNFPNWQAEVYLGTFSNLAAFDIPTAVKAITAPVLFVAGTEAYTAPLSQKAYDVATSEKELFWIDEATHVSLYYVDEYMNQVTDKLVEFFNKTLQ